MLTLFPLCEKDMEIDMVTMMNDMTHIKAVLRDAHIGIPSIAALGQAKYNPEALALSNLLGLNIDSLLDDVFSSRNFPGISPIMLKMVEANRDDNHSLDLIFGNHLYVQGMRLEHRVNMGHPRPVDMDDILERMDIAFPAQEVNIDEEFGDEDVLRQDPSTIRIGKPFEVKPSSSIFPCYHCGKEGCGSKCGRCKSVVYCTRTCQQESWKKHKVLCKKVEKQYDTVEGESLSLLQVRIWNDVEMNAFEDCQGDFWGMHESRDYMRARYALINTLLQMEYTMAYELALEHLLDMCWLCRSDNMGLRDVVPHVMLQLGQIQEAYDFQKWWLVELCGDDDRVSYTHLSFKEEDVFESLSDLRLSDYTGMCALATMFLIKYIVFREWEQWETLMSGIDNVAGNAHLLYTAPLSEVQSYHFSTKRRNSCDDKHAIVLLVQLKDLLKKIHTANSFLVPELITCLENGNLKSFLPTSYSSGSKEEVDLFMHNNFYVWKNTDGVKSFIRQYS